jgi:predicted DNA-binding transcriptional regulator YafY
MSLNPRPDADRRLRQANRLARVLRVLELIQGRRPLDVKEIAAELECSERTIYRDLSVLVLTGVPYETERETGYLRVRPGFRFPSLNLSQEDLIGQVTATVVSSVPGLDVTKGPAPTTRKLQAASRDEAAKLMADVERVTCALDLKLADHRKHHATIRTIQLALVESRQLAGTYASPYESRPKRLTLDPYRICLVGQAWYLIARPSHLGEPRTYRVARFKSLRMLDVPAVVPARFDLKAYFGNAWKVYRGEATYEVRVRFSADAANLATETVWHPSQRVQRHRDGGVTLSFRVDGLNEVLPWVLGWSGQATVIEPMELRSLVLERLRKALEKNEISPGTG